MQQWFLYFVGTTLMVLMLKALVRQYVCFRIIVPTSSMAPTIQPGDHILVRHQTGIDRAQRGALLVFRSTQHQKGDGSVLMIKRLIGLPGETIELRKGDLLVNGQVTPEQYIEFQHTFDGKYLVPGGCYLFLGDNRPASHDARYWDVPWVREKEIIARAGLRIWPVRRFGFIQ
ncbi:MAG: signal peptidase I [Clostridiaceae bacterium]